MRQAFLFLAPIPLLASLIAVGCTQSAAAPTATAPPPAKLVQPTSASEPTRPPATQPAATSATKDGYPAKGKSVTYIVPWAAGGGADTTARVLAEGLEKELGVPIQVVNKPGASSQVGITELVRTEPDGYTIGLASLPSSITVYLDRERQAIFGRKDLQPVALQTIDPNTIVVKTESSLKSLKDLIDAAKAKPEKITVSTDGLLSDSHLLLLALEQAAGVKFNIVHFQGGFSEHLPAVLGGHVDAAGGVSGIHSGPFKAGQIRLLGIADKQRNRFFPDVPTFKEQGYDVSMAVSRGVMVRAGTPKEILGTLSSAIKKAMETERFQKKMEEQFMAVRYMGPEEFSAYWDELEAMAKPLMALAKK